LSIRSQDKTASSLLKGPSDFVPTETLFIQTAFVGDLLLSIPVLKELRKLNPAGRIALLCRKGLGEFMLKAGLVDEICEIEKGSANDDVSWIAARAQFRGRAFSLVLCPHESFRSAKFAFAIKAKKKIGYKRFFNALIFTDRVERPMALPEAMRQLALLVPLGKGYGEATDDKWRKRLADYEKQTLRGGLLESGHLAPVPRWAEMSVPSLLELKSAFKNEQTLSSSSAQALVKRWNLSPQKRIAVLAPGSVWPTKMWNLDGYTRVARELLHDGWQVLALGAKPEIEICQKLARRAPGVISVAGETKLWESTELIALATLVICNDSGAMHMASAAATPAVSIFGPTVLDFGYRPWQHRSRVVQVDLECRPCGKHGSKECPLGTHACMKKVAPEAVLASARSLLSSIS
jgi:heptosyltransferase-2